MQILDGGRAAAYLSSYFITGKGRKATLQDNARNPHLPRMLIWSLLYAHRRNGDHDAESPSLPSALGGADGIAPAPSWTGVELARIVLLAGPWPVRGP